MSSVADPQPEQPTADELLVAYLDGELAPDDCRHIEQRLAADADYRQQLRDLDQAWEALDVLPATKSSDDFARTTMELVTVAAQADATSANAGASAAQHRRRLWYAAAAIAGALVGVVAALALLPNRDQALLRDLPVIRQADALRLTESVDFLRQLSKNVPAENLASDEAAIKAELSQLEKTGADSLATRREWVESLPADDKLALAAEANRFHELKPAPAEQDRLRTLQSEIHAAGPEVERTLLAYGQWLSRLTAGKQDELRQAMRGRSAEEQVKLVAHLVVEEQEQFTQLSPEDSEKLRNEVRRIIAERKSEFARDPRRRNDGDRGPRMELSFFARDLWRGGEGEKSVWKRLVDPLSPEAHEHLESLHFNHRVPQLWKWIAESMQAPKVDSQKLERFFAEKLDSEQRERLLSLPQKEMQAQLERLYYIELGYGDAIKSKWWNENREQQGGMPNRMRPGGRGFGPDGPPNDRRRPDGPPGGGPPRFNDRDQTPPGPGGPGGPGGPPPNDRPRPDLPPPTNEAPPANI